MHSWNSLIAFFCTLALVLAGCMDQPEPETEEATMAPGSTASIPMVITDAPWDPETVTVDLQETSGLEVNTTRFHSTGNDTITAWVSFTAGAETAGDHEVRMQVSADGDSRDFAYTLHVEAPEEPIEEGEQVTVHATGRTGEGELVFTTQAEIADAPLAHSEVYQEPPQTEAIPLPVAYNGQLPDEIVDALIGGGDGHTMTVIVDDFFGPATMEQERPREEEIPRTEVQQREFEIPRAQAEQQGMIGPDSQEGDPVSIPGLPFTYVIDEFREDPQQGEIVVIVADVEEGDLTTLHPQWPDSAEVTQINDTTVELTIHPPYGEGETFTWVDGWEDATEITHMDDEVIILRHSPSEGLTYTQSGQQPGQEVEATVVEVGEQNITISQENPDPMGGETIYLELTIVDVGAPDDTGMGPGADGQQGPQG